MLDAGLAALFGVAARVLIQAVKGNTDTGSNLKGPKK
jgi:hypothetical protein